MLRRRYEDYDDRDNEKTLDNLFLDRGLLERFKVTANDVFKDNIQEGTECIKSVFAENEDLSKLLRCIKPL